MARRPPRELPIYNLQFSIRRISADPKRRLAPSRHQLLVDPNLPSMATNS